MLQIDVDNLDLISKEVLAELKRALGLFGEFNSMHEGYAILLEELDELWDDIKHNSPLLARKEAVQVAAMAIKMIHFIDTQHIKDPLN